MCESGQADVPPAGPLFSKTHGVLRNQYPEHVRGLSLAFPPRSQGHPIYWTGCPLHGRFKHRPLDSPAGFPRSVKSFLSVRAWPLRLVRRSPAPTLLNGGRLCTVSPASMVGPPNKPPRPAVPGGTPFF